jgi:hypothetical protein
MIFALEKDRFRRILIPIKIETLSLLEKSNRTAVLLRMVALDETNAYGVLLGKTEMAPQTPLKRCRNAAKTMQEPSCPAAWNAGSL